MVCGERRVFATEGLSLGALRSENASLMVVQSKRAGSDFS